MDRYAVSKYRNSLMGLAILWVVFYHGPVVKIPILHHIQELGYLGVEIFFTLSGFGLYYAWNKSHNICHFYGRRILRIIPSYFPLLFLRIAWDANSAGGGYNDNSYSFILMASCLFFNVVCAVPNAFLCDNSTLSSLFFKRCKALYSDWDCIQPAAFSHCVGKKFRIYYAGTVAGLFIRLLSCLEKRTC